MLDLGKNIKNKTLNKNVWSPNQIISSGNNFFLSLIHNFLVDLIWTGGHFLYPKMFQNWGTKLYSAQSSFFCFKDNPWFHIIFFTYFLLASFFLEVFIPYATTWLSFFHLCIFLGFLARSKTPVKITLFVIDANRFYTEVLSSKRGTLL